MGQIGGKTSGNLWANPPKCIHQPQDIDGKKYRTLPHEQAKSPDQSNTYTYILVNYKGAFGGVCFELAEPKYLNGAKRNLEAAKGQIRCLVFGGTTHSSLPIKILKYDPKYK
ncbi:hypothetical protein HQ41_06585 [Porphyromonas sp. COT-290 OH860]|nr:hypothetical protein HQ41_06585 [Porphyromonas sp. COT-290 OH860]